MVTIIGELYGCESLTQVYGFLHSYIHDNADKLSDLVKLSFIAIVLGVLVGSNLKLINLKLP